MGVLGKDAIGKRLQGEGVAGPQIFKPDSWAGDCFRGAAYDLRIASDWLITPKGTRYWKAAEPGYEECLAPFSLEAGEVAFVSSVEELCMPHDLAGNIAPRFRRALEGILVMGGMLVDPGYEGRLHFQLANIGDKAFEVVPGKTSVAAIQFLPVEGELGAGESIPQSDELLNRLFHRDAKDPLPPLAFFSDVGDLKKGVAATKENLDDQRIKLDATKRSTDQLLVFGVFLVSITLFTVAVAALLDALAGGAFEDAAMSVQRTEFTLPGVAVSVLLLLVVGTVCWAMMRPLMRVTAAQGHGSKNEDAS
ncbi:MAG: hypothetical protein WA862_11320 [Solirubrobacterales bacterium]